MSDLQLGQLVCSKAGRDRGRLLIVVGLVGERFALVADGEARPIESPKRKNVRHLQPVRRVHEGLAEALSSGRRPTNEDLRVALAELSAPVEEVESGRGEEGRG